MAVKRDRIICLVKHFPPLRTEPNTARIVKHLGRQGWRVDVLHALPGYGEASEHLTRDETQLAEMGENVRVFPVVNHHYLRWLEQLIKPTPPERYGGGCEKGGDVNSSKGLKKLYRSLTNLPDKSANWLPTAVRHTLRLINNRHPALLLTSGPPFTTHLAGRFIKELTGIPWVAHFRDLFIENPLYQYYSLWRLGLDRALERWTIRGAEAVTTVYPEATFLIRQQYGRKGQIFRTVRNGYDEDDFEWAQSKCEDGAYNSKHECFTFLHGGRLAGDESHGRTAHALLDGLQLLMERRPELRGRVRLNLVGSVNPVYRERAERYGLGSFVDIETPVTIREMIRRELTADCLLIILEDSPKNWFTAGGKIYECARAGKPILGILPENSAAELIRRYKLGRVVPYGDAEAISAGLENIYEAVTSGDFDYGGPERDAFVEANTFSSHAREFGEVFEAVLKKTHSA